MTVSTPVTRRQPIRQLSASVVNKIAAGEVIERPASVVKELLENSIDAGARQIEVVIAQGGLEEIRITDDGRGIAEDELVLAVASHATSKIIDADDLFKVGTLGFRGEALASIAEVSQFELRSRTAHSEMGFELRVNGGVADPVVPCGMSRGSVVIVRNLFFNTPVRRKFLRTSSTELGHVSEAFTRVALAFLDRQFTLIHNDRLIFELAATEDWRQRIDALFGSEIGEALIPVERQHENIRLHGYVVDPAVSRSNNRLQYLFLNGRYIRDRSLQHALGEAYRGLLMVGRFPICFLRLELPADLVDVNVHPAKLEVRFQDGNRLYSHLLATVRDKFLSTDLTARGQLGPGAVESAGVAFPGGDRMDMPPSMERQPSQPQIGFTRPPQRNWIDHPWASPSRPAPSPTLAHSSEHGLDSSTTVPQLSGDMGPLATSPTPPQGTSADSWHAAAERREAVPNRLMALQVQDTYLVTETEAGLVVIDQHALHERILYEQLRERVDAGGLECQRLLVPEPVELRPAEAAAVLQCADSLRQVGIAVEDFGGDTILVTSYPAMLSNHNPGDVLRSLVELLQTEGAQVRQRDVLDELLHMIACKAAVKAGDRLSRDEIAALLEHRQLCRDAHHCPHGRPTALVFSREDLDRKFKRI